MFEVTRQLHFCYGHRLLRHAGKCAHLHGHNAMVEVSMGAEQLDDAGMVVDFQIIRDKLGTWLDAELDHRMILQTGDPAIPALRQLDEPLHVVDFEPTAENLAKYLFEQSVQLGLPVCEIRFWETPHCYARYR